MYRAVSCTASVPCSHAAIEKHKSGKNYVVVMLGILGTVFLLDLLPICVVKIPFAAA